MGQLTFWPEPPTASVNPTIRDIAAHYLRTVCVPPWVTPYTQQTRRYSIRSYVLPTLGDLPVASVTTEIVRTLQRALIARGLSVWTVRLAVYGCLAPILSEAERLGLIADGSLTAGLRWPRDQVRPDPLTPEDRDRILRWFGRHRPHELAFVALVWLAALRPSEAAALTWGDIDLERGCIEIRRAAVNGVFGPTKTPKSSRLIYVSGRLRRILLGVRPKGAGVAGKLIVEKPSGGLLVTHHWSARVFRRCLEDLGLYRRGRGLYRGRTTYLTEAASEPGVRLSQLAGYAGTSLARLDKNYVRWVRALRDPIESARKWRKQA